MGVARIFRGEARDDFPRECTVVRRHTNKNRNFFSISLKNKFGLYFSNANRHRQPFRRVFGALREIPPKTDKMRELFIRNFQVCKSHVN